MSNTEKHLSDFGCKMIWHYEGCSLTAYWDDNGKVWTIGWGHTGSDVYEGLTWTQEQCDNVFKSDIIVYENYVKNYVTINLEQHEFDSMVSFTYNTGVGTLTSSDLLKYLNEGDKQKCADEFPKFIYSGGVILEGLVKRRKTERTYFLYNDLSDIGIDTGVGPSKTKILSKNIVYGDFIFTRIIRKNSKVRVIKNYGTSSLVTFNNMRFKVKNQYLK